MIYGSQVRRTEFFVILDHFLLLYPIATPKIKMMKKWKKKTRDITILHMCIKNENHMYCSCDMERDGQNFLSFWTNLVPSASFLGTRVILDHFLPFYPPPPNNQKNQNLKKMKRSPGDIIILHKCTINDNHVMYGFWDMECDGQNFLAFWIIFCPFTLLTTQKISKKWKKRLEIS